MFSKKSTCNHTIFYTRAIDFILHLIYNKDKLREKPKGGEFMKDEEKEKLLALTTALVALLTALISFIEKFI